MASAGDVHSILYKGQDPLKQIFKPRYDPTKKVKRYFPGQAPDFVSDNEGEEQEEVVKKETIKKLTIPPTATDLQDSRLRRLQGIKDISEDESDEESAHQDAVDIIQDEEEKYYTSEGEEDIIVVEEAKRVKRRRRELIENEPISKEESLPSHESANVETIVEESAEDRRKRMKARALEDRRKEEERLEALKKEAKSRLEENGGIVSESDDNEESDVDSLSDEKELMNLKPVFIPASKRESVQEQKSMEIEEENAQQRQQMELEERKKSSKKLLVETIAQEEEEEKRRLEQQNENGDPQDMPDDTDDQNEEEEYELWKIREFERLKKDKEETEMRRKLEADIERRRNMTDKERMIDDQRLDSMAPEKAKKGKYTFLQKYYHRGAFYQDRDTMDPILLRDFNKAVGEDAVDKKMLPKPMQLRRGQFGKAGQVKHTHLADVDTTDFTSVWTQNRKQNNNLQNKMAGSKGANQFDKPSARKKEDRKKF